MTTQQISDQEPTGLQIPMPGSNRSSVPGVTYGAYDPAISAILNDYRAGRYGAVGTQEAIDAAALALANLQQSQVAASGGVAVASPDDAMAWAMSVLAGEGIKVGATGGGQPAPIRDTGVTPLPGITPDPADPNLIGGGPIGVPPSDPTGSSLGVTAGGRIKTEPGAASSAMLPGETLEDYYTRLENTEEGRASMFGAGVRGRYSNVANPFLEYLLSQGPETFNQYALQSAFGGDIAGGYHSFVSDPNRAWLSPEQMRATLGTYNNLLLNPTGLGTAEDTNEWLPWLQDPSNQFNSALYSMMPGVAGAAQPYYQRAASRAFNDYQVTNPQDTWLNSFVNRGYRFW